MLGHRLAVAVLFSSLALPPLAGPQQPATNTPAPAKRPGAAAVPKGLFPVRVKDLWGYIDGRGTLVIAPQFEDAEPFSGDLAAVRVKGKWGFIDQTGALVIPAEYGRARKFSEGFAAVGTNLWRFIDRTGKAITTARFQSAGDFAGGLAWARSEDDWDGFVQSDGTHLVFRQYDWTYPLDDGLALVKVKDKCGFIDREGRLQIPADLDCKPLEFTGIGGGGGVAQMRLLKALTGFSDGMAAIAVDDKWGYIDKTGKIVIAPQFTSTKVTPAVQPFSEGLAAVSVEGKWGYVDKTGKLVVKPVYEGDEAPGRFSEGRAAVPVSGKWGYIDASGKTAVPPQFTKADPYANELARVWLDGKVCYIDKAGRLVWKPVE